MIFWVGCVQLTHFGTFLEPSHSWNTVFSSCIISKIEGFDLSIWEELSNMIFWVGVFSQLIWHIPRAISLLEHCLRITHLFGQFVNLKSTFQCDFSKRVFYIYTFLHIPTVVTLLFQHIFITEHCPNTLHLSSQFFNLKLAFEQFLSEMRLIYSFLHIPTVITLLFQHIFISEHHPHTLHLSRQFFNLKLAFNQSFQ